MKFGFPTLDQLKWRNDYVLSYDRRNKTANWVGAWELLVIYALRLAKFILNWMLIFDDLISFPEQVFEHLTEDSCRRGEGVERKKCDFKCDPSVHPFFQSSDSDYKYVIWWIYTVDLV